MLNFSLFELFEIGEEKEKIIFHFIIHRDTEGRRERGHRGIGNTGSVWIHADRFQRAKGDEDSSSDDIAVLAASTSSFYVFLLSINCFVAESFQL